MRKKIYRWIMYRRLRETRRRLLSAFSVPIGLNNGAFNRALIQAFDAIDEALAQARYL